MKKSQNKKSVIGRFNNAAAVAYTLLLLVFCLVGYRLYCFWNDSLQEERGRHLEELTESLAEVAELYASSRREMIRMMGAYIDGSEYANGEELILVLEEQNRLLDMEESEVFAVSEDGTYYKSDGTIGVWENKEYLIENIDEGRMWIRYVPGEEKKQLFCWIEFEQPIYLAEENLNLEYYSVIIDPEYLEETMVSNAYAEKSSIYILGNDGSRLYRQSKMFDIPLEANFLEGLEKETKLISGDWETLKKAVSEDTFQYYVELSYQGEEYYLATSPVANLPNWNIMVVVASDVLIGSEEDAMNQAKMYRGILAVVFAALIAVIVVFAVYLRGKARLKKQKKESVHLLELAAKEANRANRAKTELLSHISHDIRTPIGGVMGMTHIAKRNLNNPEKVEDCLDKIQESADYLLSLVNTVLDLSKIENGEMELVQESFDLPELLKQCVEMLEGQVRENKVWFYKKFDTFAHPYVLGDKLHLEQVLMNILSNALKYTSAGGKVTFTVTEELLNEETVEYCFTVRDTGIGMNEEFLKRIYLPYSKADEDVGKRYHGTGLGMTIAKKYIDAMQGTIQVESEQGNGSKFIVRIAFPIAKEAPEKVEEVKVTKAFTGIKILAVEDVPINLKITVFLLENMGFTVDTALNGVEAVEAFSRSAEGEYAAILMDVMMPEMDGLEATEVIRKMDRADAKAIPIVAATASAFEDDRAAILAAGMNTYLLKPLNEEDVFVVMKNCLFPDAE